MWQYITLMKRIYLIDCPGIVPPSGKEEPGVLLLRGVVRVENVENPAQYIPAVLERCRRHHVERTYDVKIWHSTSTSSGKEGDGGVTAASEVVGTPSTQTDKQRVEEAARFLEVLARKGGRLLRGGEADMDGVAKMVLNDFLRGKIPWFVAPPREAGDGVGGKEGSRDEKLGFTHGKRKREVEGKGEGEVEAEAEDGEEEEDEEDGEGEDESEEDDEGGFDGFDDDEEKDEGDGNDDDEEDHVGGAKLAGRHSAEEAS